MRSFAWGVVLACVISCGAAERSTPPDAGILSTADARAMRAALHAFSFAPTVASAASTQASPKARSSLSAMRVPHPLVPMSDRRGFELRRRDASTFLTQSGFVFALHTPSADAAAPRGWNVRCDVIGARADALVPHSPARARVVRHGRGQASESPTYDRVAWDEILPGIDLIAEPAPGGLAYRFVLSPGAKVSDIALRWDGATAVRAVEDGRGVDVDTGVGTLRVRGLRAFSVEAGRSTELVARHFVDGAGHVRIQVDGWSGRTPLIIDPTIAWATYLGGADTDFSDALAMDTAGNVVVAGLTASDDFPTTTGAHDTSYAAPGDVFLTKLSPTGAILWSTYLGGSGDDSAGGVAINATGDIFVTGTTTSADFPASGAFGATIGGGTCGVSTCSDAFVAKLTASGGLVWSAFLGGSGHDQGLAIAVDEDGNALVTGQTRSTNFPSTGGFDTTHGGGTCFSSPCSDAFVTKVSGAGALLWSTFLGGGGADAGNGIAVDGARNAVVVGTARSNDFPTTGGIDATLGGTEDAFVTKLSAAGALVWSTYLGGGGTDWANAVAVDGPGNIFVTGRAGSSDFPSSAGLDTSLNGTSDAFVTRLAPAGTMAWSTFLGGGATESGLGVTVDSSGRLFVVGSTTSNDFPTSGGFDPTFGGGTWTDGFVVRASSTGAILWGSYLGGANIDSADQLALDASGNAVVFGTTYSSDFPASSGLDSSLAGTSDAFVARLGFAAAGAACAGASECISAFCADGVCCNAACVGGCVACTAARKGSGADGVCAPVAADTDPKGACAVDPGYPSSCGADGSCDGAGACRLYAKVGTACGATTCTAGSVSGQTCNGGGACETAATPCTPYACGAAACKSSCAADTDCAPSAFCGATGACIPRRLNGASCGEARECASALCADGVCCNSVCSGRCESCNEPGAAGTCTAIVGKPRGTRGACDGRVDTDCAKTACDGVVRDACAGFANGTATPCGTDSCTGDKKLQKSGNCDGRGLCALPEPQNCVPYVCAASPSVGCKTSCSTADDCATGYTCKEGTCTQGATCNGDRTASIDKAGQETACAPYRCGSSGECLSTCTGSDQCAAGAVCDPTTKSCVVSAPSATDEGGGCGCAVKSRPGGHWLAVLAIGLIARRRRTITTSRSGARSQR